LRWLVFVTCAAFWLTPRGNRRTTTRGLTFTTTEWVVDRVHGNTTSLWANALPTVTSGLTDLDEFVL
jgi:hypothetical protein